MKSLMSCMCMTGLLGYLTRQQVFLVQLQEMTSLSLHLRWDYLGGILRVQQEELTDDCICCKIVHLHQNLQPLVSGIVITNKLVECQAESF